MKPKAILIALIFCFSVNTFAVIGEKKNEIQHPQTELTLDENHYSATSVDEFLNLTPRKIKKQTGQKLSLKEVIVLKAAQKKMKKALKAQEEDSDNPKSQLIALLLVILIGSLGIHRFYLGYIGIGIIQLLTLGGCGIWALIDMIRIITGDLKPKDGSDYDPEL